MRVFSDNPKTRRNIVLVLLPIVCILSAVSLVTIFNLIPENVASKAVSITEKNSENQEIIKQSDGTIINPNEAIEMVKNMVTYDHPDENKINKTDFSFPTIWSKEYPISYENNLRLYDNSKMTKDADFGIMEPTLLSTPKYLNVVINNTVNQMMQEWNQKPFIKNYEDADIPRITNTTVMTVKGYVVLDDSGNKVITLGTGNVILTDHVFTFGDYVTLNKVVHDQMCAINYVTISNGTEISGNLASQVYDNPEKFGLMSKEDANTKWGDWSNSVFYAHGSGCDNHEFVTWELVHKN